MKRSIYLIVLLAFALRLGLGVSAYQLLPQAGYPSKTQQAGYLFFDAYRRDNQAWELAESDKALSKAFEGKYASDQYGGLLWVSALIYRYIPMPAHQPLAIVFLAALVGSLGVIFVYKTAKLLFDQQKAWIAALIFAFFPEAILLGASQMREPFLMTFIAIFFYGLVEWQASRARLTWLWMGLALAGLLVFSPGIVLVSLLGAAGWLYFSNASRKFPWQALVAALGVFALALIVLAASWDALVSAKGSGIFGILAGWTRETATWNSYLLGRSSGIVQLLFEALPPALAMPFVAIYGVLQPVLPAALLEPALPFWQTLGIVRASGWYLLLPFLAFAPFSSATELETPRRRQWWWISALVWGWILVAAVRGGGDQWDNPRYRVILLAWMAILAAQAFGALRSSSSRWFWRIVGVESIILLVFGHWYFWRYLGLGLNIGIRNTLVIAIGLSTVFVLGDWLWCRFKPASRL